MPRLFIGNINNDVRDRDIEKFFKGYGKIREIILKNGFGFVEFDDERDADDAVYDLNGKDLCGQRVTVEPSKPRQHGAFGDRDRRGGGRDRGYRSGGYGGGGGGRGDYGANRRAGGKFGPPRPTQYRVTVTNLSSRVSWQDLKDLMHKAGEVTYADAHKDRDNEGYVCFATLSDMKRAIEKYDGTELNGRKIKIISDYKERSNSRSRSRSGPRSKSGSASPVRRSRKDKSGSRSRSRSHSASPKGHSANSAKKSHSRSRSRSASRSVSPKRPADSEETRKKSRSCSGSRSPAQHSAAGSSRSGSPEDPASF